MSDEPTLPVPMSDEEYEAAQAAVLAARDVQAAAISDQSAKHADRVAKGLLAQAAQTLLEQANAARIAADTDYREKQAIVYAETERRASLPKA